MPCQVGLGNMFDVTERAASDALKQGDASTFGASGAMSPEACHQDRGIRPVRQSSGVQQQTGSAATGGAYEMMPMPSTGPYMSPAAFGGSGPVAPAAPTALSIRSRTSGDANAPKPPSVGSAWSHKTFMSDDRHSQLSAETDEHARTVRQLEAEKKAIAERRKANKQAKKERKAAEVAKAQAEGYVKQEWTPSMESLYDKYKDGEKRLANATAAYDKFRSKFDHKGNNMTKADHKHAADLANNWEQEAESVKGLREKFFYKYPKAYALPDDPYHKKPIDDRGRSAAAARREVEHHTFKQQDVVYGRPPGYESSDTPSSHWSIGGVSAFGGSNKVSASGGSNNSPARSGSINAPAPAAYYGEPVTYYQEPEEDIYDVSDEERERQRQRRAAGPSAPHPHTQAPQASAHGQAASAPPRRSSQASGASSQVSKPASSTRTKSSGGNSSGSTSHPPVGYFAQGGVNIPGYEGQPYFWSKSEKKYYYKDKKGSKIYFVLTSN